jgi:hypothetical protein
MSSGATQSPADAAAASASLEIARLNEFPCDGQHFGWFCETVNAILSKQSVAAIFGKIHLGACIFAKFPEASSHMREIICSSLVKMNSKFASANLSIIIWALRSLWKIGCGSSNLHSFSTYLAQHAAIHADAAAPLMLSHHRHHVVGALYYNLIAIKCLTALSMRSVDCASSSLEVDQSSSLYSHRLLADIDSKLTLSASNPSFIARLHSTAQHTPALHILSNVTLRALVCIKLLGLKFRSSIEEKSFLTKLLHSFCVSVRVPLQDATGIHQPPHLFLGSQASVVFKSSVHLVIPQVILQVPPLFSLLSVRVVDRSTLS